MESPIIVALDNLDSIKAIDLVQKLKNKVWGFKINDLAYSHEQPVVQLFNLIKQYNCRIMFDPKWHDIPNTVSNYCRMIGDSVDIITVHASGGWEMINAAVKNTTSDIAAVTVLTSLNNPICKSIYHVPVEHQVETLLRIADDAGATYVVCGTAELQLGAMKETLLKKIVPGIRLKKGENNDQKRVASPSDAINSGADLIVIGRPITMADDPAAVVEEILDNISEVSDA